MKDFIANFGLNLFSLTLLIILLLSMISKKEIYRYSSRLIMHIIISIAIMLGLEIFSWLFDGIDNSFARFLNYFFNLAFFVSSGIVLGFFATYIDFLIYKSKERIAKRLYYMHGFIIMIILGIVNLFVPLLFTVDSSNLYHREPFIILGFGIFSFAMFYFMIIAYLNKSILQTKTIVSIYVFMFLPFIAGALQMIFYGVIIMWSGMALGVVIAYIFTESISVSKDYLTKLYTRAIAVEYMERQIHKKNTFSVLVLDLDDYKLLNDKYGHKEGDKILVYFSNILLNVFGPTSIISRFGGDEFVIVSSYNSKEIDMQITRIEEELISHESYELIRDVKFSYGYTINKLGKVESVDEILDQADLKMYEVKSKHKNLRRRISDYTF